MSIYFQVNGNDVELDFDTGEEEEYKRVLTDDNFAVNKIFSLVHNGQIQCKGKILEILRGNDLDMLYRNPDRIFVEIDASDLENQSPKINTKISDTSPRSCSESNDKDWQDNESKYLLDQVFIYFQQIGPQKKFKTKKAMWVKLAQEISQKFCKERTYLQVENRYKTILRRKKCAIDNNSQSGSSRQNVPFEEELHKIASTDDSIQPEVVRTATSVKRLKNSERISVKINSSLGKQKKTVSITEKLEELHEKTEIAREKRHQDKMALIRELWRERSRNPEQE